MKKNKLVLFDWGGIVESHLTGYNGYSAWNDLLKEFGSTKEYYALGEYGLFAQPTITDLKNVYNKIKEDYDLNADFEHFFKRYVEVFNKVEYYKDVVAYEHSLKDKCYIGILSNLIIFDKDRIDRQLGLSNYDYVFLSFELATRKPHIEIYELVQKQLPFDKKDILFIDDTSKNIEVANSFGWNTLLTTGLELDRIKNEVDKFLNN